MRIGVAVAAVVIATGCSSPPEPSINVVIGTRDSSVLQVQPKTCNERPTVRATETDSAIRLTVTVERDSGGQECLDPPETVRLKAPVGERRIIDDSTGEVLDLLPPED